jgi:HK97 family phage major capsid protein
MSGANDAMLSRLTAELEERRQFQEGLVEAAQAANRDLNQQEMELYQRAGSRMADLENQLEPLRESARIALTSNKRTAELQEQFTRARNPGAARQLEYRSAGAFIRDHIQAVVNRDDALAERLDMYTRAAAHQTTADVTGLLPENLMAPILQSLDFARPLINALGARQLPSGSWTRPRVTQHTQVAKQAGEKTELASRKMVIDKVPLDGDTFGGYVNVSRQSIDWTNPNVMDIVIADLTSEYAFATEEELATVLWTGGTGGPIIPTGPADAAAISGALWAAAAQAGAALWGNRTPVGRLILAMSFDMMALVGPAFAPVNAQNAQSTGFNAAGFGEGPQAMISGITPIVSGALDVGQMMVISSSAVEVYEDRIGALQVVEPSVLGTQVAYAGHFAPLVLDPAGVVKITKVP